jgi:putative DNA primase/helicase
VIVLTCNQETTLGDLVNYLDYEPNQAGFARLMFDAHSKKIRYVPEINRFYVYDGVRWEQDTSLSAIIKSKFRLTRNALLEYVQSNDELTDSEIRHLTKLADVVSTAAGASGTATMLSNHSALWCGVNDFSERPWLLNFRTGTLDLSRAFYNDDGDETSFRPHDPEDMLDSVLDKNYHDYVDVPTPLWDGMLLYLCGDDKELARNLEQALAYGLYGANPEQLMVFLVGNPATGKTQILEIVTHLAGSLGGYGKIELITSSGYGGEHDSLRADLRGKRFVMLGEAGHKLKLDTLKFNDLTGSGTVPTRKLGQEPVQTRVTWTLYAATNELPDIPGYMDDSVERRLWIFDLPAQTIPAEHRDSGISQRVIQQEGEAILRRFAKHLCSWYGEGSKPERHVNCVQALDKYRTETDTIGVFAKERLREEEGARTGYDEVHEQYVEFCKKHGYDYSQTSRRMFVKRISQIMMCERDFSNRRFLNVAISFEAPSWLS